jgi:hypothetical protein
MLPSKPLLIKSGDVDSIDMVDGRSLHTCGLAVDDRQIKRTTA